MAATPVRPNAVGNWTPAAIMNCSSLFVSWLYRLGALADGTEARSGQPSHRLAVDFG